MQRILGLALAFFLTAPVLAQDGLPANGPAFLGIYQTWQEQSVSDPTQTQLALLPKTLDVVVIFAARPDLSFDGTNLASTGLQLPFNAQFLAQAIAALKLRNPNVKVLVSVGGSAYAGGWSNFQPTALLALITAIGADGVDLDYEPQAPNCAPVKIDNVATIKCASDAVWTKIVQRTRAVLPRPYLIGVDGWSVGAYGVGKFVNYKPVSQYTGSMLWIAQPVGALVDILTVLAYDAGPTFDPSQAYLAYSSLWRQRRLLLGMTLPPDAQGGLSYTAPRMRFYASTVTASSFGGVALYGVNAPSNGKTGATLNFPDGAMAMTYICHGLGRGGC